MIVSALNIKLVISVVVAGASSENAQKLFNAIDTDGGGNYQCLGSDVMKSLDTLLSHSALGVSYEEFVIALSQYKAFRSALKSFSDCVGSQRHLYGKELNEIPDMFKAISERSGRPDGAVRIIFPCIPLLVRLTQSYI